MKKRISKTFELLVSGILIVAVSALIGSVTLPMVAAAEDGQEAVTFTGHVVELKGPADAYASPDASSEKKASFAAGESVFVTSEGQEWYEIFYKGDTLYIPSESFSEDAVEEAVEKEQEQAEALTQEIKQQQEQALSYIDEYERQQKIKRNALIWKIVIGVLVAAIIAVSVVIGIRNKQADEEN